MSAGPSSSGEVLELCYTFPIMMLRGVLEPAEEKAVTGSATGRLDVSTSVLLPQVAEEHCTRGAGSVVSSGVLNSPLLPPPPG